MEAILFACSIMAVCIDVRSLATNVTDSSSSPNSQSTINNDLDRKTPDSRADYYDPTPNSAPPLLSAPWRGFHPLARLQSRGMLFGGTKRSVNPFWGGMKRFGMPPMFRATLGYYLFGDENGYVGRYPGRYGPYGVNPYGRYGPDQYASPLNDFDILPPGSPYYNDQLAQPFQPPSVEAPPYYPTQPGMQFKQSQRPSNYQGQPSDIQSHDRNQLLQPNSRPHSLAPPSYYTEQPATPNVQSYPVSTSAPSRNDEQGKRVESQLEAPPTLPNSRDQRTVPVDGDSQPVQDDRSPNARIRPTEANMQPQYTAAG